jgi:hypothetical protein
MTRFENITVARPVDTESLHALDCSPEDLADVECALAWAQEFLAAPNPELGRKGPVCPYIRHSFDEQLLHVVCRDDEDCDSYQLRSAVRKLKRRFAELQDQAGRQSAHLVSILIILPRIDRTSAESLNELHSLLKDEFVAEGLMIGQFHPDCDAAGLWNDHFRPLKAPIPLLAIREMVSSDLPFLVSDPHHAAIYLERFARGIPAHTRRFMVDRLVADGDGGCPVAHAGPGSSFRQTDATPLIERRLTVMDEAEMYRPPEPTGAVG